MIIAKSGLSLSEAYNFRLRDVIMWHDQRLLDEWDHTSLTCCMIHNLCAITMRVHGGKGLKPATAIDYHPYRSAKQAGGMTITKDNFKLLKNLAKKITKVKGGKWLRQK